MQEHLERAARLADDQDLPPATCEALGLLALEAARLGRVRSDESLIRLAERSAENVTRQSSVLPGHPPWQAQALAARASAALFRGDAQTAAGLGKQAFEAHDAAMREDLDLDIILPAAEAIIAGGTSEEAAAVRERLQMVLGLQSQRILDEKVRVEWFQSQMGRDLVRLAGTLPTVEAADSGHQRNGLTEEDSKLLGLLVEGRTNQEIADAIGSDERTVATRLADLFVKIGASSRADATVAALVGGLV
jgi:DNA-binding NarL/FixJ family response regulator